MKVGNPVSVTSGCPNAARTVSLHRFFDHTNPIAQHGVYEEPLPSTKGSGGTLNSPFGVRANIGQQIP